MPDPDRLRALYRRLSIVRGQGPNLEKLLCNADGFGLTTASPLQRAICRIADGRPLEDLSEHPDVVSSIGHVASQSKPKELLILSGIRTAKSMLAAAMAIHWSQTCDLSKLGDGETPRVAILSLTVDLANVVFDHIVGNVMAKESLKKLVVGTPTKDSIVLKHPGGRDVEIKIAAGARAGSSLVARWLAGVVFDEAPLMQGQDDAVVNFDEARRQVLGRLLPGAQIVSIGSPWAPFGPIYEMVQDRWKKPTQELVVVRAPGWVMNPYWWTEERRKALMESDLDAYMNTCAAEFQSPGESLLGEREIDRATRVGPADVPYDSRQSYVAAMDPATRGNSWTLVISTRVGNRKIVVLARQWTGTRAEPLSPKRVLSDIAAACGAYGVRSVHSDRYFGDALVDMAKDVGLTVWQKNMTDKERTSAYLSLRDKILEGEIELPPDQVMKGDLMRVNRRTSQTGVSIVLPKSPDGRHCDFAPSLVLSMSQWLLDAKVEPEPPTKDEVLQLELKRMRDAAKKKYGKKSPLW